MNYENNFINPATITYEEVIEKVSEITHENGELADLGTINIDETKSLAERFASFMEQIKNPYEFTVNGLTVSLSFDGEKSLADALGTALAS